MQIVLWLKINTFMNIKLMKSLLPSGRVSRHFRRDVSRPVDINNK